jgi:3-hydroxyisobutyrate dehydrogenase-like beta-hydroxyacid dehydrogenase
MRDCEGASRRSRHQRLPWDEGDFVLRPVGQIGLGAIGSIYAGHLLAAGVQLVVFDKDPARTAGLDGAVRAVSAAELAGAVDHLLVSLPDPDAARATLSGPHGVIQAMKPGSHILDVSTIDPETARALHAQAAARGVGYVEAPVSGGEPMSAGTDGARNANITFMAAGDRASFDALQPLMSILGRYPMYLGPAGTGSTVKLLSNHLSGLINLLCCEAFAVGKAAGIAPQTLLDVFAHTDANSYWLFNYFAPRILRGDFEPGFSVDLQYKDLRLMEDVARGLKAAMPFNALGQQIYQMLRADGRGGRDLVEAANLFAGWAGVEGWTQPE